MREKCARVLAAALMTGAIGFALAMPALFGTSPGNAVRPLTAPPSSLRHSVEVVASARTRSIRAEGHAGPRLTSRPELAAVVTTSNTQRTPLRESRSAPRPAPNPPPTPAPRPTPSPAPTPAPAPPATPTPAPQPTPPPPPTTDTRTLANETPATPAPQPAPSEAAPSGPVKSKAKGKRQERDDERAKPASSQCQPGAATTSDPAEQSAKPDDTSDHNQEHGRDREKGRGRDKGQDD
jgi:hypothetical protein